jgi:hypothetical protein
MVPNSAVGDEAARPLRDACAELANRLRAGEPCRAEDFFPALPGMDSADVVLELIYTEFVVREEMGQRPSSAVWLARFPQWHDRLERMLQIGALCDDADDLVADDSFPKGATVRKAVPDASAMFVTRDLDPPAKARTLRRDPDPWVDEYELLGASSTRPGSWGLGEWPRPLRSGRRRGRRPRGVGEGL